MAKNNEIFRKNDEHSAPLCNQNKNVRAVTLRTSSRTTVRKTKAVQKRKKLRLSVIEIIECNVIRVYDVEQI